MATSFALSGEQKNELAAAIEAPPEVPDFARTGEKNPNLRVFVVNFDGTQNDRDHVPKGDKQTLVADNFVRFRDSEDEAVATRYYKGVGTVQYLPTTRIVQSATGMGCISNAEQAHQDFCAQAKEWLEDNPNAEIHVHVVGFSRGSATALHFLNLVDQRGAVPENGIDAWVPERLHGGRVSSSAVLLDTVSTGQGDRLELTIPESCVAALHIVAKDEQRALFPMREISAGFDQEISLANGASMHGVPPAPDGTIHYHRIQEIKLPGVHSDIGGSYIDGGIANISSYLMDSFQQSLGLDVKPVKPTAEQIQSCRLHDSRFGIEKFLVGDTPKENSERYVQKVQNDRWDGTWGIQTRMSAWNDTGEIKLFEQRHAEPNPAAAAGAPTYMDAGTVLLGKSIQIMLMPEACKNTYGGRAEFAKDGVRLAILSKDCIEGVEDIADMRSDGLYVAGKKIKGSPSIDELKAHWAAQEAKGEQSAPVSFKMDAYRVGATCVCAQDPTVKVAPPEPPADDPWPRAVRSNLRLLNTAPSMKPKHAEKSMELAAKAVANALVKDNPLIASAKIVPISVTERTSSSTTHTNRFAIECTDIHGKTMSTENPPTTRAERDMHERLCGLARGMNAVSDGLAKIGFKPQANVPYVYARDVTEKMNDARMQPYPNAPKPHMLDMRFEGPMPQPEASLGDKLNNLRHKAGGVVLDLATQTIRKAMGT